MSELKEFIKRELINRRKLYTSSPTYILEHFNGERQNIEAYNGRQMLEMLQNADDASENASDKQVLIKLSGNELIIANNGESFTEDGFRSILYISVSSKTKKKNKIGHKGLGFRSILSWADEITVHSGDTKIRFSNLTAQEFLQDLIEDSPEIEDFLAQRTDVDYPIATLRVPKLLDAHEAEKLGFDTLITIKLKPESISEVQKQISNIINRETLIFLNNIDTIEIQSPEKNVRYVKKVSTIAKSEVKVESIDFDNQCQNDKIWKILRRNGKHKGKNFELAIAWNEELDDVQDVLFSYFKTEVKFPFPAIIHGTFELSQDRNHLERDTNGHNRFLTEELAELIIQAALKITSVEQVGYKPIKLLNIDFSSLDAVLIEYKFEEILVNKIRQNKLFPNVNGDYITYDKEPVYYDYPIATVLSGADVEDLMPFCDDKSVVSFLHSLTLFDYTIDKFFAIVSKRANAENIDNLAELIYHLVTFENYATELAKKDFDLTRYPKLLLDTEYKPIPWEWNSFIQPVDGADLTLPKFLNIKFVQPEFINALKLKFKNASEETIMKSLGLIGIKEYSFVKISETLIEHYRDKDKLTVQDVIQLHQHLFKLYKRESKSHEPSPISIKDAPVITLNNKVFRANLVYLSKNYGEELTHNLYSFDKSKLLSSIELYKISTNNIDLIKKYFLWLGVASYPRYYYKKLDVNKTHVYIEHVFRSFKYPLNKWGYLFKNYTEFYNWLPWDLSVYIASFDEIENICTHAKIQHIFEWINREKKLKETLEKDKEVAVNGYLDFYKFKDRRIEKHEIPSYTKWQISNLNFLTIEGSNNKVKPNKCCLSKTITTDFSPFVEKPKIPIANIANKLELSESVIEHFLILIGVHKDISSFSLSSLYEVLNSLPTADKTGKAAKKMYREVISNFNENKIDINHPEYKKFIKDGKIFAKKGQTFDYFPISASYYLPTKTYGSNVLKRFALAEIDSKQGPQRIEKLFGVKRLKDISFSVEGNPTLSLHNDEFQDDIEKFKALIYVLRKDKDTSHDIAGRLKRLKIYIVDELVPIFTHNDVSEKFTLEECEYINNQRRNEFYISVSSNLESIEELRNDNKFCQSISEIFSVVIETDEYSDFIHDLYSKTQGAREPRLLSYTQRDDSADLAEAKRQLNIIDDIRVSFWRAFYYGKNPKGLLDIRNDIDLDNFLSKKLKIEPEKIDTFSQEFFYNLTELHNLQVVYDLFLQHKVNYIAFARHFFSLDFSSFFKDKIEDCKIKYRNEFALQLFNRLSVGTFDERTKFFDYIDKYSRINYLKENSFIDNLEGFFKDLIHDKFSVQLIDPTQPFNVEEKMSETLGKLKETNAAIPHQLKENRKFQALLLFSEFEELNRMISHFNSQNNTSSSKNSSKKVKIGNADIEYEDYETLAKQILSQINIGKIKIKATKTAAGLDQSTTGGGKGGNGSTRNVRFEKSTEELVGFISELLCYHRLVEKHGEDKVNWVSENANRAYPDKFLTKEAGSGYDLELRENEKSRFIEIKGIGNIEKGIYMSKEEIRIALEFPDRYDLMLVENPLGAESTIRHITSPFKFKKGETLFANSKVKVFNDNYILKFKWDEK